MLEVGAEFDFDTLVARLVELAYTRVDMVGKRGEFAVRGGILDIFPPTAEHPVRVEFWGDEITEMRMFAVADQRSIPELDVQHRGRGAVPRAAAHRRTSGRTAADWWPDRPRGDATTGSPAASATCWPNWPRASRSTVWRRWQPVLRPES